jgi:hypothetical protein
MNGNFLKTDREKESSIILIMMKSVIFLTDEEIEEIRERKRFVQ